MSSDRLRISYDTQITTGQKSRYQWVLDYVLLERLNLPGIEVVICQNWFLVKSANGQVALANHFLSVPTQAWGTRQICPDPSLVETGFSLSAASIEDNALPIVFPIGRDRPEPPTGSIPVVNLDVFGTVFYFLSGYDEWTSADSDSIGRFPSRSSYLYRAGLLRRAVADEYIDLLGRILAPLYPNQTIKKRVASVRVSCDVDWPFGKAQTTLFRLFTETYAAMRARELGYPWWNCIRSYAVAKLSGYQVDRYRQTLSWIMTTNEQLGNRVTFYFISESTSYRYDSDFDFSAPAMRELLHEVELRGHDIGIHPGFRTSTSDVHFRKSVQAFRRIRSNLAAPAQEFGGRQHYLKWSAKLTAAYYDKYGVVHDSTLGFEDAPGFRCGTCHDFPLFDLSTDRQLNVVERPLMLMDTALTRFCEDDETSRQSVDELRNVCAKHGGIFNVLWHNSVLFSDSHRTLYQYVVRPFA